MAQDQKQVPRKQEWKKPEVRRIRAGQAENTVNFDPDGGVGS